MKFNLVDDPWIKVIGKPRQSLKGFFSDLTNTGFCGNAVEKIAMLRFMLSLTHAAIEVPDKKAWDALTPEIIAAKVLDYLEKYHDCFELFGEKPFLQFPQLKDKISSKIRPCNTLYHWVSYKNNKVLSHWNLASDIEECDLPLLILCCCGMAMGDKRTDNSITLSSGYNGKLNDKGNAGTGKAGVLLGKKGYLHSYLSGENAIDTIHLNLLTEEEIKELDYYSEIGRPAWENMPVTEDCQRAKLYKETYQGMLLPLDKFFFLFPESQRILLTDGIDYPTLDTGLRDPALTSYPMKNNQYGIVEANMSHRPWRELPALLAFVQTENKNPSPFFLSAGIKKLAVGTTIHVWTAGLQVSSNAGEQYVAKRDDYIESDFYFPNVSMDVFRSKYCNMMTSIEKYAKVLYSSVNSYFKTMYHAGGADNASAAVELFWELMEKDAQMLVDTAAEAENDLIPDDLVRRWKKLILDIYNKYCPQETARQLLAWSESKPFAKAKSSKKG